MTCVVLADGDRNARNAVAESLRHEGYVVLEAGDGGELMHRVHSCPAPDGSDTPVAVVADADLIGTCETDVRHAVFDAEFAMHLILTVARNTPTAQTSTFRYLADAVIDRPLHPDEVLAALHLVLDDRGD
jgi:DNA-binding response OmpR family regulator